MNEINDISLKIAHFLKKRREELNFTQEKLAELAGIEYKHIQNLESFKRANDPKLSTLIKLSDALGVKLSELINVITE